MRAKPMCGRFCKMSDPTSETTAFLIAGSYRHAMNTAEVDWRWKRVGAYQFETPSGERVRVICLAETLRGCERGTRVYLGYHWWENNGADMIHAMIETGIIFHAEPEIATNADAN